jgi:hypothetical protein
MMPAIAFLCLYFTLSTLFAEQLYKETILIPELCHLTGSIH